MSGKSPRGETRLCLNGHVIEGYVTVGKNSTLELYDCGDTAHYYFKYSAGSCAELVDEQTYDSLQNDPRYTTGAFTGGGLYRGYTDGSGIFIMRGGAILGGEGVPA